MRDGSGRVCGVSFWCLEMGKGWFKKKQKKKKEEKETDRQQPLHCKISVCNVWIEWFVEVGLPLDECTSKRQADERGMSLALGGREVAVHPERAATCQRITRPLLRHCVIFPGVGAIPRATRCPNHKHTCA